MGAMANALSKWFATFPSGYGVTPGPHMAVVLDWYR